ncbi:MAG: hypothetical protein EZS28_045957, partial [Streblomastix strix]
MTLPVFIRNMHITRSKDETQEFTDNADLIKYGSKFIEQWYQIYRTETQKYNVPKRQLPPKRPQPMPKQEIEAKGQASEEQRILTNPYRTKNKNVLSDGEKGLTGNVIKKFCNDNNISLYFNSSP